LEKVNEEHKPFFKLGQLEQRLKSATRERDELLKSLELAVLYLDGNPLIKAQVENTIYLVKASIAANE
jgi:hypothetical protein